MRVACFRMSTGSVSEEEVVEVSSDEEVEETEMEEEKKDLKNGEVEELEEPLVRIVVTQRAKVDFLKSKKQTTKSSSSTSS